MREYDLDPARSCPGQNAWRIIKEGERVGLVTGNPPDWDRGHHYRDVIKWIPKWAFLEAAKPYRATQGFAYTRREGDVSTDLHGVQLLSAEAICFEFRVWSGPDSGHPIPVVVSRAGVGDAARKMTA